MSRSFAPGKIILSGEYAVVFGYAGIAVPSSMGVQALFEENSESGEIRILWEDAHGRKQWLEYVRKIVSLCECENLHGQLTIHSTLPVAKGMGSSTALVVSIARALLGDDAREEALCIEDALNPGHSGLDFATIWSGTSVLFRKGTVPKPIEMPAAALKGALLIDTGLPNESTTELVEWMRNRESEVAEALRVIGDCTDRLVRGEPLSGVMRDHHKAQVKLGVVPTDVQEIISLVESSGGAAKVIGAGSRTGGGGMVLALGDQEHISKIATQKNVSVTHF